MTTLPVTEEAVRDWRDYDDLVLPPILAAALVDLREHGYHGTTVRSIAAGVGLTMPSLYYHYGNKEGILVALLDLAMDDLLAHIAGGVQEAGSDTQAKFDNCVLAVLWHATYRVDMARLHDEARFLTADARARYITKRMVVDHTLEEVLREGGAEGLFDVDDPHFMARAVNGLIASIQYWYRKDGPLPVEKIAEEYLRSARRMVGAREPEPPAKRRRRAQSRR